MRTGDGWLQEARAEAWWNRAAQDWGPGERLLACGAAAVADLRAQVFAELGYTCSAGEALTSLPLGFQECQITKPSRNAEFVKKSRNQEGV